MSSRKNLKKSQKLTQKNRHINIQARLDQPIFFKFNQEVKFASFSKETLDSSTPFRSQKPRRKIYPSIANRKANDLLFYGGFENAHIDSVYVRAKKAYEIHISPDPLKHAIWFFFKCENIKKGVYTFIITGFSRDMSIFHHGVQPVCFSMHQYERGIGWEKIGNNINYWLSVSGSPEEYTLSFTFRSMSSDTMYFAFTYPYTYSSLIRYLRDISPKVSFCVPFKSTAGLDIPLIFWDADNKMCLKMTSNSSSIPRGSKPLIIIIGRHHPVETNSSFAIEGFIHRLFEEKSMECNALLDHYSILIIPMINVDGVVCGFTRSGFNAFDLNKVWKPPLTGRHCESNTLIQFVDVLAKTRRVVLYLDFHGHTKKMNVFSIGMRNRKVYNNELQGIFTRILRKTCQYYDFKRSSSIGPKRSQKTTRTAFHLRYHIPFAYTIEMSMSGTNLYNPCIQFSPNDFKAIGSSVCTAVAQFLINNNEIRSALEKVPQRQTKRINSSLSLRLEKPSSICSSSFSGGKSKRNRRSTKIALSENVSEIEIKQ